MEKLESNIEDIKYLNKIISYDKDLFFQFTKKSDDSFTCDYLSDSVVDFYELSASEIKQNPNIIFEDRIFIEDQIKFKNSLNYAILNLDSWNFEFRINLPKRGLIWVFIKAKLEKLNFNEVNIFGKIQEITNFKNLEDNHKISEARSQFANMASEVGVWDWDLVTNKVYYSDESLKILEIDDNNRSVIDNPESWDNQVHPDDREAYFGNIKLHFEQKIPFYETYHRILCNGKYKWILDRGKVILRDNLGNPLRIVGTHTDVSSQKLKEENLSETLNLVNNQKNKLLNFAHIVSHNLKTHTGNLGSLITMRESGMFENEEAFTHIKSVSQDLSKTLENLIDLVEVETNEFKSLEFLNVNQFLQKTLNILLDDFNVNKIKVINNVPDNLWVSSNPAYLESILLNLTTNAIKYSNPKVNSTIEYYTENHEIYKVLCVKDNGLGIDLEKHKDHIFGMYKTFHKHENATGIGLYITKNQIESLGGKIEVESKVNKGTIFKIYFK